MTPQEKFELLIDELEGFIEDEAVAIRQDNWAYLADLLRKKENHLRTIGELRSQTSDKVGELPRQIDRIKAKETLAAALMAEKMDAARNEMAHLRDAKTRVHQLREHVKIRGYQVFQNLGGLSAQA